MTPAVYPPRRCHRCCLRLPPSRWAVPIFLCFLIASIRHFTQKEPRNQRANEDKGGAAILQAGNAPSPFAWSIIEG
ncbi:MAG: hypothetical protein NZ703_04800 [Gemmataceae bacterium]|nr:hypothetical protein [Gemmataceae bacterium]